MRQAVRNPGRLPFPVSFFLFSAIASLAARLDYPAQSVSLFDLGQKAECRWGMSAYLRKGLSGKRLDELLFGTKPSPRKPGTVKESTRQISSRPNDQQRT